MNQSLSLIINKSNDQIDKVLKNFKEYLLTINTGIITPKLVDSIYVETSQKKIKISYLSTITVRKNIITINPWDKKNIKIIEKALLSSPSNFSPYNDGKQISISIPPLTRDDRQRIIKELKKQGENFKISIRQIRKSHNNLIKIYIKENKLSSNLDRQYLKIIQEQTNNGIMIIEKHIRDKTQNIIVL